MGYTRATTYVKIRKIDFPSYRHDFRAYEKSSLNTISRLCNMELNSKAKFDNPIIIVEVLLSETA
jgi:hypothetical protein